MKPAPRLLAALSLAASTLLGADAARAGTCALPDCILVQSDMWTISISGEDFWRTTANTTVDYISASWGDGGGGGGGSLSPEDSPACQELKNEIDAKLAQASQDKPKVLLLGETHDTFDSLALQDMVDAALPDKSGACFGLEYDLARGPVPEHYQQVLDSMQYGLGLKVFLIDGGGYTFDPDSNSTETLNALNGRDAFMASFISGTMSSQCSRIVTLNGVEHVNHDHDPVEWSGLRTNLADRLGNTAEAVDLAMAAEACGLL
jgi:hypothetical protein